MASAAPLLLAVSVALLAPMPSQAQAGPPPPVKHEITSLPGLTTPLPSRMYNGWLNAGTPPNKVQGSSMYFHYWLIESERDPTTDPVIIWYNGGPGASSLFGLLQELGPLLLNEASLDTRYEQTGVPTLQPNEFSWTKYATVIAIDSPPPIGLSFCSLPDGPAGGGLSCGPWDDFSVFAANRAAYAVLFNDVFPELKSRPIYLAGESYGGIYVPGIANELMSNPISGLNFRGFLVGDGWTGCPVVHDGRRPDWCIDLNNVGLFKYPNANQGLWYDIEFFHGHSQFSESLYREIRAKCTEAELRLPNLTNTCQFLVDRVAEEVGGWFPYFLYNQCNQGDSTTETTSSAVGPATGRHGMNRALHYRRMVQYAVAGNGDVDFFGPQFAVGADVDRAVGKPQQVNFEGFCPGRALPLWFALNATLDALVAPRDLNFLNLDNGHGFNYTSRQTQVTYIYGKALSQGLRVLVYEGDSDPCGLQTAPVEDVFVPYFASIGLSKTSDWRPWTTDGEQEMGGYVIEWEKGQARFVSIRGSGHLVPMNRPHVSSTMLKTWLAGDPFPVYKPPSPSRQQQQQRQSQRRYRRQSSVPLGGH